ncbi:MAG: hypothetical protein O7D30_06730, partial [Rickettsia endosymbiont of Ixodes persulcatus]|nr:hypothetical protein [Rickettsia endosymbiont of Ixodes persulcatus]
KIASSRRSSLLCVRYYRLNQSRVKENKKKLDRGAFTARDERRDSALLAPLDYLLRNVALTTIKLNVKRRKKESLTALLAGVKEKNKDFPCDFTFFYNMKYLLES